MRKKHATIWLPEELHRRLKLAAVYANSTISNLACKILQDGIDRIMKNEKKRELKA